MVDVPAILPHANAHFFHEEKLRSGRRQRRIFSDLPQLRWHRFTLVAVFFKLYAVISTVCSACFHFQNSRVPQIEICAVLHNVHIADGVHANENAQFIQVSFTMPARYTPAGGELIPFSSVRVGKGNSSSNVGEWFYPCDTNTADVPTIYGEAGMAAVYEDLSQARKLCFFALCKMCPHSTGARTR